MEKQSLEYRLLHPTQPVDPKTKAVITYSVDMLIAFMNTLGEEGKPKRIVVDNNAISMTTPNSKMITAAGYVPKGNALYLYSPTTVSIRVPLSKPLEEMTQQELLQIVDEPIGYINSQLIVVLRDYVIEQPV